jgi:formylglycine-generating enzyme required for sulfatase activity
MRRPITLAAAAIAAGALLSPAWAQVPRCAKDMTRPGSFCMDIYEASVWRVPDPTGTNKPLVRKIQRGAVKLADLIAKGAVQLGTITDDFAPCTDNGQTACADLFAASIAGVRPAVGITWFQAQQACANSGKRLPRSAEWQQAVAGTPDPGADDGVTDCNTSSAFTAVATGSRSACASRFGNYDMVGNASEWVEDWVPRSSPVGCPGWGAFSDDVMCLSGASTTADGPGALVRGASSIQGPDAGPLSVEAYIGPEGASVFLGFRCAR